MDKRSFSFLFVAYIIALAIYLYYNNNSIAAIIAGNGLQGIMYYFLTNPAYVLLFVSIIILNRENNLLKTIIGTLAIIISIDIVSYPRFSPTGLEDGMILASSDGILMNKLLSFGLEYSTAYALYYLIFPILLILVALALFGYSNLFKRLMGQNG